MDRCPHLIETSGADLHAENDRLRARGPVTRVELPGGVLGWSVTGYRELREVLADPRFSKAPQHWPAFADGTVGEDFPMIGWVLMENLTTSHGEDHQRLRRPLLRSFSTSRAEELRGTVEKIAETLLDAIEADPDPTVDLRARYAHPLPAQVICDLFGVPEEARAGLLRGGEVNIDTTQSAEEAAANVEQWHREIEEFIESKRQLPGDDLTSDLVSAHDAGELGPGELLGTLHLLLATGTTPVMNLVANAVVALLTHPAQLDAVRTGRVGWRDVIEETLRVEAPVAQLPFRFATEDVEVGGVRVPAGEPVLAAFAAAGRDPAQHGPAAGRFDVERADKRHLSFGHGAHRCLGSALALVEAEVALSALFRRFPDIELAVDRAQLGGQHTFIMNGPGAVEVRLRPSTGGSS